MWSWAGLKRRTRGIWLAGAWLAAGGCAHGTPPAAQPGSIVPATLGPTDVIEVRVFGEPDLSGLYQVGADGHFDFPLAGHVRAEGQTESEVAGDIVTRLRAGYLRNPQVTLLVKEQRSRRITILGSVQKPGTFTYVDRMSILEAISLAGGFTPLAAKNDSVVTRGGRRFRVRVEEIAEGRVSNFYLDPGDTILVPERIF